MNTMQVAAATSSVGDACGAACCSGPGAPWYFVLLGCVGMVLFLVLLIKFNEWWEDKYLFTEEK